MSIGSRTNLRTDELDASSRWGSERKERSALTDSMNLCAARWHSSECDRRVLYVTAE